MPEASISHPRRIQQRRWCMGPGLVLAWITAVGASAQQPATPAPLVFDRVTVVDVDSGRLLPAQRVVINGNRIQAVGSANAIPLPPSAQVIDAQGKYLI